MKNPWSKPINEFHDALVCDATCRVQMIRRSEDVNWLNQVLAYRHNQSVVRQAAAAQLRKLQKKSVPSAKSAGNPQ